MTNELVHPERKGLQIYAQWLSPLPRPGVSPTDLDFVLHRREGDRLLVFEFKPPGKPPSAGQEETFDALRRRDIEVYTVFEDVNRNHLNNWVHEWWRSNAQGQRH